MENYGVVLLFAIAGSDNEDSDSSISSGTEDRESSGEMESGIKDMECGITDRDETDNEDSDSCTSSETEDEESSGEMERDMVDTGYGTDIEASDGSISPRTEDEESSGGMESDVEEMEHETADSDKTSNNEDSDSTIPSGTEDEESSEMDDEDYEKRRSECLEQMADLEKQFYALKEQLYEERTGHITERLEDVKKGNACEFLQQLKGLKENMMTRKEVAQILKELNVVNIQHKVDAEKQAALQNFESEKALLWDSIKSELEDKIRRLEEDRNSIDITSDLWNEQINHRKNKRRSDLLSHEKRRKPVTVSGPYVVYMLHENDILEDWTTLRKALKAYKQNNEYEFQSEQRFSARFADGTLLFKGDSFRPGQHITIEEKNEPSFQAQVISVNTSEVLLQKQDTTHRRIYISDLQSGKFCIRHPLPYSAALPCD